VAQRVGIGIALLFHYRDTRRGWVVSSTLRPHFTHRKDPVPILQEAGWTPWPVWRDEKSRPHRDSIPDRPARSHSLYRLSYQAHYIYIYIYIYHHVPEGLGVYPVPWSSRWSWSLHLFLGRPMSNVQYIYIYIYIFWHRARHISYFHPPSEASLGLN